MITYLKGDLFNSPAQVLVNAVNTVGVMGKGVALEFKKRYPAMFKNYQKICDNHTFEVGKLYLWKGPEKWVLLFPTKQHWRNPSKLEYIEAGLKKFAAHAQRLGIESIAFPKLGCGNGGLRWEAVQPVMERYLKPLPLQIYIYVDSFGKELPEHRQQTAIETWLHSSPDEIGFNLLKEDVQRALARDASIVLKSGETAHVTWQGETIVIQNGRKISVEEGQFCELWSYMRDSGVFAEQALPEKYAEFAHPAIAILKKLDYLQDVVLSDNGIDFDSGSNGYQYAKM